MTKKENIISHIQAFPFQFLFFLPARSPLLAKTNLPLSFQGDVYILKIELGEDYVDTKRLVSTSGLKEKRQAPEQDVLGHSSQSTSQILL